jgi:hypothetical protein
MVNSRQKGNQAERDVCKIFRKYFTGTFERKPMGIPGPDILCPPHWIFAVEVKNDKKIKAIHLLCKPLQLLDDYWKQADAQADALDKSPLLIAKVESFWFATENRTVWIPLELWCAINAAKPWNKGAQ